MVKLRRLYLIPGVRERVARFRFLILGRCFGIRTTANTDFVNLLDYSRSHFTKYSSIRERVDFLVNAIGNTKRLGPDSRLLVLGPRYESEIFGYMGLGFSKHNISALDTFSYSKMITPGNLHNMPYSSEEFDFVICGWTLAYSENLKKALVEIHRVLKIDGVLIMTFDLRIGEVISSLPELKIANFDAPLLQLIEPLFTVRNYFLGRTSWAQVNVCCLTLEKR